MATLKISDLSVGDWVMVEWPDGEMAWQVDTIISDRWCRGTLRKWQARSMLFQLHQFNPHHGRDTGKEWVEYRWDVRIFAR